jgi:hypothetical protein
MKKVLFLISLFVIVVAAANAQSKSCCSGKSDAKSEASAGCAGQSDAKSETSDKGASCTSSADAEKAASSDASIVRNVSKDGEVTYQKKEVDSNGKVTYATVEYCSKSEKFVSASGEKSCCSKDGESSSKDADKKKAKKSAKS